MLPTQLFIAIVLVVIVLIFIGPIRRLFLTGPLFKFAKRLTPKLSIIERQAIDAGTDGFDTEIFKGNPNWDMLRAVPKCALTKEEEAFLAGPTQELCNMIDDWHIRAEARAVPDAIWSFAKKHGFLGLRISKSAGGHGFSTQAQSIILGTVASRSLDASTIVEVPNSLGPDELIEEFGTDEQKEKYLKSFVTGEEVACFAITSPMGGSDAANMRDVGYVQYGNYEGKKVLGISVSWSKRYITLAPKATVIALAFHLFDPDKLLQGEVDRGITLALVPSTHAGVNIGRRHLPSGVAFPNGPTWGDKVFIPLSWVIGGESGVGKGWLMIMQCLAAGRGVSLPSMSTAGTKLMLRVSTAYARVRRQFNKPIGKIEGVEEPLARIAEAAYVSESGRAVTAAMVTRENRPLVLSSILKYQLTEYSRRAVNDAMDIHGGKAVIDGPSNYLQSTYQIIPVAITVEGANIITRSLIVIGQAVLRSHPYFGKELRALESNGGRMDRIDFDRALAGHAVHFMKNVIRSLIHGISFGAFARSAHGPRSTRRWYRQLSRYTASFAFLADFLIIYYRGALKKKQKIGGRVTDALADLYLLACVLKRFEDDGALKEDYPIVELCLRNGLARIESSFTSIIDNQPSFFVRLLLRIVVLPFGRRQKPASDRLATTVVSSLLVPSNLRDRLTRYIYIPEGTNDSVGLLELAMKKSVEAESALIAVDKAVRSGNLSRYHGSNWLKDALDLGVVTDGEYKQLVEVESLVEKAIAVDHFDPSEITGLKHRTTRA